MENKIKNLPQPFRFSQSSLQDYLDCPRRFQLRYIQKVQWPAVEVSPYIENERRQIEGQIFHRMVQQFYLGLPPEKISMLASSENLLRWWNNFISNKPDLSHYMVFTELALSARIENHRLTALFDLVAVKEKEPILIFDWKTYHHKPSHAKLAERMQTKVYSSLMLHTGNQNTNILSADIDKVEMTYWFAGFPDAPEKFIFSRTDSKQSWMQLENLVIEIDSRQSFPLTEDERICSYCVYRSLCERGIKAGEGDELESIAPADFIDFEQIQEIEF